MFSVSQSHLTSLTLYQLICYIRERWGQHSLEETAGPLLHFIWSNYPPTPPPAYIHDPRNSAKPLMSLLWWPTLWPNQLSSQCIKVWIHLQNCRRVKQLIMHSMVLVTWNYQYEQKVSFSSHIHHVIHHF